jgi:hypothetical protein
MPPGTADYLPKQQFNICVPGRLLTVLMGFHLLYPTLPTLTLPKLPLQDKPHLMLLSKMNEGLKHVSKG